MAHFADCRVTECICDIRRYKRILYILLSLIAFEVLGWLLSKSLMLLGDITDLCLDTIPILIALCIAHIGKRKKTELAERFDYYGAKLIGILFIGTGAGIGLEAYDRWNHPHVIEGIPLLITALIGAGASLWQHRVAHGIEERTHTHRGMSFHILSHVWQNIAVVGGALIIITTDFARIDTIISGIIATVFISYGCFLIYSARHPHPHIH